jgi:hypothetical protein
MGGLHTLVYKRYSKYQQIQITFLKVKTLNIMQELNVNIVFRHHALNQKRFDR